MKKFINDVNQVENEMVLGIVEAHSDVLKKLNNNNVVIRKNKKNNKVALISGGGSGHEPTHIGYVGFGMLDAVVPGSIFSSPTPDLIYEGIKAINSNQGVFMIVKNYTGDVMNFEMAKELAENEGIKVDHIIVNDDVAVDNSSFTVGRRGVAGTVFVHKVLGALAEQGASLSEIKTVATKVVDNIRTMGVAISPCIVPAAKVPGFVLKENEMEVGIGIHGEPGTHKEEIKPVKEIVKILLDKILKDKDFTNSEIAIMVNGAGGTPLMELYIAYHNAYQILKDNNIKIYKAFIGEYMTSLEMQGLSITLFKLDNQLKKLLDAKSEAIAFKV